MDFIYAVLDTLLPIEALTFGFMKNAFLAILLLTPLLGLLGTMAVNQQMSFFSDALGHSALTGIGIGVVLGVSSDLAAMLVFGIIWSLLLCWIKQRGSASTDTVISVFSSTSIAAGLLILSRGGGFAKYSSLLIGDVLAVKPEDLLYLLLALIAGIEHPSGGEVLVDGEPVRAPTGKAGLMPQRDQLFDWRTIWGNVTLGLEVRHENTPARRGGVHDLLEQYQLAGFARKLPNQLSGGMRQRCALIRTLATSPDVLLLDEPLSALDYQTRLAVSGDISQIIRREHKTALLVTHDISEAISLSDRIIVLSHRPATVKAIHDLGALRTVPPLERRSRPEFQTLFNQIWEELDVNV